jgi:hypothetical protein
VAILLAGAGQGGQFFTGGSSHWFLAGFVWQ